MIRIALMVGGLLLLGAGCVVPSLDEIEKEWQQKCAARGVCPQEGDAGTQCPTALIQAYPDADGDGHGAPGAEARSFCEQVPASYSRVNDDCDDFRALVHPGATEVCDVVDNDCDGQIDEELAVSDFYLDADGDGVGAGAAVRACGPPLAHVARAGDCDDGDPERGPGLLEMLDGKDNNCSGGVDEALFSAGEFHAVSLRPDGTLLAWGRNGWGELGDGTATRRDVPVPVPGLTGVVAIAAGAYHTVALKQDGTVWTWGLNEWGQLGIGETAPDTRLVPTQVQGLSEVTAIDAGRHHSVALRRDGTVWAWGHNTSGELGDWSTVHRFRPVQVKGLSNVVSVVAGSIHTVALRRDGSVWAWGFNGNGQLGDETFESRPVPAQVLGMTGVASVTSRGDHTVALKRDGTVWAWGRNDLGQLGDGTTFDSPEPVQVSVPGGAVGVFGGGNHTMALARDGTVWAWGSNAGGQLGTGSTRGSAVPVRAYGLGEVVSVMAGWSHSFAVRRDGTAWVWGSNEWGMIGDGTGVDRIVPTPVPALNYPVGLRRQGVGGTTL
ncbi:hypothetical protein HPC49_08670 [Pyxidicoccus fallax]|uniref:RCC1-like domain-containing protein n=1 Tax=Pyxidicoccus fallax TaxID=394095 RepID=A0A848L9S3_9BACT|nr:MopE-related protein [Pyxidicoccus fallax]NMO13423.1 hypothetical protein [Pyxidicoccus fallax]NPC78319.1 hypothetical protein [Pyxidicoccus fallax]